MIRILLVLLIAFLVVGFARRLWLSVSSKPKAISGEKLVKCHHCGVYITQASAVTGGKHYFCSDKHRAMTNGERG